MAGARPTLASLSLAERVCLTLIDQGVEHGWAIGTELAAKGDLGRIWSLSRPLTYRALEQLDTKQLIARRETGVASRRDRTILRCTAAGRRIARAWLDTPVAHLREVRTELLLKLVLRQRRGLDNAPLLAAQQAAFHKHFEVLTTASPQADLVDLWRRENARAVRRFLDAAVAQSATDDDRSGQPALRLSARNQLRVRITEITHGEVTSLVRCQLPDGQRLTSVITKDAVLELDMVPDDDVVAVIKSTEIMLAAPDLSAHSPGARATVPDSSRHGHGRDATPGVQR